MRIQKVNKSPAQCTKLECLNSLNSASKTFYFSIVFKQSGSFAKSGERLTTRMRLRAFRAMLRQEMSYFDDPLNNTGALTTRLATDASRIQGATGIKLGQVIQGIMALGNQNILVI